MAKIGALQKQAWGTMGALAAPLNPGALNFGVAGILALTAGIIWYLAATGPGWVWRLPR